MYRFPLCVPSVSPSKIHNTVTLSIKEKKKISYRSFKHSLMNLNSNDMIEVALIFESKMFYHQTSPWDFHYKKNKPRKFVFIYLDQLL